MMNGHTMNGVVLGSKMDEQQPFDHHCLPTCNPPTPSFLQLLRICMNPPGNLIGMFSPRELLIRRNSRRHEDGSYLVLLQSEPTSDPPSPGHVRADLVYAGFTFAPLVGDMTGDGGECLVTMVLKADLGGWL